MRAKTSGEVVHVASRDSMMARGLSEPGNHSVVAAQPPQAVWHRDSSQCLDTVSSACLCGNLPPTERFIRMARRNLPENSFTLHAAPCAGETPGESVILLCSDPADVHDHTNCLYEV
jgi:hypothetical protein